MTLRNSPAVWAASVLTAACFMLGCAQKSDQKKKPSKSPAEPATGQKSPEADSKKTADQAKPNSTALKTDGKSAVSAFETVALGDPALTAGIPGEGPLSIDEIKKWLDQPANHTVLKVKLPLGLAAGRIPAGVLENNPLTRAKIELGRQLYFDTRLSKDNTISCASCHHPDEGYARHTQFGVGIEGKQGNRNSPMSYNRILSTAQFWDGRAASLEDQAIGPIANPIEMGNTHDVAVKTIRDIEGYRVQFSRIFGKEEITIQDVGKAIAAFERTIVTGPSAFDYYEKLLPFQRLDKEDIDDDLDLKKAYDDLMAKAKAHPMSASAIRGRNLFFSTKTQCSACHVGANLADEKYHNLGIGMDQPNPDLGRYVVTKDEKDKGAFKTPTIRNVALTAPFMHDGSLKTLMEVVEHYDKGGFKNPWLSKTIKPLKLTPQDKQDLVEFMKACTGAFPKVETGRLPK